MPNLTLTASHMSAMGFRLWQKNTTSQDGCLSPAKPLICARRSPSTHPESPMRLSPRRFSSLLAAWPLVTLLLSAPAPAATLGAPTSVVDNFQAGLLAVMKEAETLSPQARFDRLAPRIDETFHIQTMIRVILGPLWEITSAPERERLTAAFRRMSIATLATLFDGYSGETFQILGEKPGPQNTIFVETLLQKSNGDKIDFAYVGKPYKDSWRAVDVIVDKGISELSLRRSEYNRILQTDGVAGLIRTLEEKADSLLRRP